MLARLRLQQRFEESDVGRSVLSAFIIATLIALVAINVPSNSYLRDKIMGVAEPYLNATGLDQNWKVFAANPRHTSVDLRARVKYADGTTGTWRVPQGSALLGNYWDYRWRKWMENVTSPRRPELWRPSAAFIARQERDRGRRPVRVTLFRRTRTLNPPGARGPDRGPWKTERFYNLRITPRVLRDS